MKRWSKLSVVLIALALASCGEDSENSSTFTSVEPLLHRATPEVCEDVEPNVQYAHGYWLDEPCQENSECTTFPKGRCTFHRVSANTTLGTQTFCRYPECASDEDCPDDSACICAGSTFSSFHMNKAHCARPGDCRTDEDCGVGRYCRPSFAHGVGEVAFHCTSPADVCSGDDERDPECPLCTFTGEHFDCLQGN